MDSGDVARGPHTPLVFLTFLQQQEHSTKELQWELDSLGRELKLKFTQGGDIHEDGEIETDGHFCSSINGLLEEEVQPQVDRPVNQAEAESAARHVAEGLRVIADQLERSVVARATENLTKKLQRSSITLWKSHLAGEVDWVLKQGLGSMLQQLPQETVIMALTLTLVKGVCEQAPRLLRDLFSTALQYINPSMFR